MSRELAFLFSSAQWLDVVGEIVESLDFFVYVIHNALC